MEIFYANNNNGDFIYLGEDESRHCIKVLRHKVGDAIHIIDGEGTLFICEIIEGGREVVCKVNETHINYGAHPYHLTMAVAPTKNIDRYEWFLEKATELGVDKVVPILAEHSERKVIKNERCERIVLSASKQSLKAKVPVVEQLTPIKSFVENSNAEEVELGKKSLKLIAHCADGEKSALNDTLTNYISTLHNDEEPNIMILIGPEGDFSDAEISLAIEKGFIPIHLGKSRLRTETAAVAAVSCIYFGATL